jgi:exosome complex component CSL4
LKLGERNLQGAAVVPGQVIGSIEEFVPGEGVYIDERGRLRAAVPGVVNIDMKSRRVVVKPLGGKPRVPRRNDVVRGIVYGAPREDIALIKVIADDRMRRYSGEYTAVLHVSQSSDTRVESIYDVVRIGDYIRGTVISDLAPLVLSIRRPSDGVVLAFCSNCGAPLYRVSASSNTLVCLSCGNKETRKVSPIYIYVSRS